MADLIDRQAAVSICDNAIDLWNGQLGAGALVAVRDAIKALPSAERHGKWLPYLKSGLTVKCSECGSRYYGPWKHCPNCGTRMERKMIITPAKFEDDFNALPKRDPDSWVNMNECVILTKDQWGLIRDTLDSLGYGATTREIEAVLAREVDKHEDRAD